MLMNYCNNLKMEDGIFYCKEHGDLQCKCKDTKKEHAMKNGWKEMTAGYELQQIEQCCGNCKFREEDPSLLIGEEFWCDIQQDVVQWNGKCRIWRQENE